MNSKRRGRLRFLIQRFRRGLPDSVHNESFRGSRGQEVDLTTPVDAYYTHRIQSNLSLFYRFALQTRSIAIRDIFAKASSTENLNLSDLLNVVQKLQFNFSNETKRSLESKFNGAVLLTLADLLANTARDDFDTYAAVQIYAFVYSAFEISQFSNEQKLLYTEALHEAGYFESAELFAQEHSLSDIAPLQPELLSLQRMRVVVPLASIGDWVQKLNEIYASLEMTRIRLLDNDTLPLLDRLAAEGANPVNGPKVSVIMPTFCPGQGIRTAIRGLLQQTWKNIEVIIVDDASPSQYQHIFTELEQLDSRISVIHQDENAGAYAARNAGLAKATGEFITTADDDDWSHPDKIASQVSVLLEDQYLVASISEHIRTTDELEFRRVNVSARFLQVNYSSLMFRRHVLEEIGVWDTVNRGGDSEFLMRLRKYYGSDRVTTIRARPLAFSRVWEGSLTSGEMYRGFTATPRLLHIWAIRQWHRDLDRLEQKPTRPTNSSRPYSVPSTFEAGQRNKDLGLFDVIYATDFFRHAKYVDYALSEMQTLLGKGLRVGYIHLDSPRTSKVVGLPRDLLQAQYEGEISQISLEDVAETRLLVVYDSAVGMFVDQNRSRITSHRSIIVDRELPTLSRAPERLPTAYLQSLSHLEVTFGSYFEIVGATDRDQERLREAVPPSRLLHDSMIWRTHVPNPSAEIRPPTKKPIVGFHTYGNKYRWPRNKQIFYDVYLSDLHETHFSGQLEPAFEKFGSEAFNTSHLVDHEDTPLIDFLENIDFWVYYPDSRLEEDVWEPVLTAMSAGKVVVLPPSLVDVYGNAAVYGQPHEIASIVNGLASNSEDFQKQARLGQAFVETYFSAEQLHQRVAELSPVIS